MENQFGHRLRSARIMRGLSMEKLAQRMQNKITKQAIGKYEKGQAMPNSEHLVALAGALEVKLDYFFRPAQSKVQLGQPVYRKRKKMSQKELLSVHEKVRDHVERYLFAESLFPPERFPVLRLPEMKKRQVYSFEEVEQLAEHVRSLWELGTAPIDNLVEILEDRKVLVVIIESNTYFDGLSCWADDSIPVVVTRNVKCGDRQRSNVAHELGHLLIDTRGIDEEKAAQRFAAAFLVPRQVAWQELGRARRNLALPELIQLKHKNGMSIQMWIYRARDLGIITESCARDWFKWFRQNGYRQEPGKQIPPEFPGRFYRLVFQAFEENLISATKAADLLALPLEEFIEKMDRGIPGAVGT